MHYKAITMFYCVDKCFIRWPASLTGQTLAKQRLLVKKKMSHKAVEILYHTTVIHTLGKPGFLIQSLYNVSFENDSELQNVDKRRNLM